MLKLQRGWESAIAWWLRKVLGETLIPNGYQNGYDIKRIFNIFTL